MVLPLGKENDLYLDGVQVTGLRPTPVISDSGVVMQIASFPVTWGKLCFVVHVFQYKTRCTQREQNARLDVTSLTRVIKYCKENNKIIPNM